MNSSFVSGPVKKVGNAAFEYPIGKEESYLPLTISAPATTSSEFVAEYKIDSLGINTGAKDTTLGYVFRDRYWTLNRTSGSSSVYVTLTWDGDYKLLDSIATTCYWDEVNGRILDKELILVQVHRAPCELPIP
ncbi:MAG: hypothetical protein IPL22_10485 [Bacteroidetes bacterium]|nr:hypothetical protein [Bacteroidota bacterium]